LSEAASLKPAFVLHHRRYQESSLIVELFTPNQGRIGVLAKGALGGKTNRSGSLQPFTPLLVDWRGRGQLPTLTHCDTASSAISLKGKALYCAMYLN
jgi:DNA repair protein RecO (recombination protein O)